MTTKHLLTATKHLLTTTKHLLTLTKQLFTLTYTYQRLTKHLCRLLFRPVKTGGPYPCLRVFLTLPIINT